MNWKDAERKIAKLLGGERIPITGRARGSVPDVITDVFAVEVKTRKRIPEWLKNTPLDLGNGFIAVKLKDLFPSG